MALPAPSIARAPSPSLTSSRRTSASSTTTAILPRLEVITPDFSFHQDSDPEFEQTYLEGERDEEEEEEEEEEEDDEDKGEAKGQEATARGDRSSSPDNMPQSRSPHTKESPIDNYHGLSMIREHTKSIIDVEAGIRAGRREKEVPPVLTNTTKKVRNNTNTNSSSNNITSQPRSRDRIPTKRTTSPQRSHSTQAQGSSHAQKHHNYSKDFSSTHLSRSSLPNVRRTAATGGGGKMSASAALPPLAITTSDLAPDEPLDPIDWDALEARFKKIVDLKGTEEGNLRNEFARLVQLFSLWIESGERKDQDRGYRRLHTRIFHVQNSDAELEKKRQHYERVVQAFENALKLLEEP